MLARRFARSTVRVHSATSTAAFSSEKQIQHIAPLSTRITAPHNNNKAIRSYTTSKSLEQAYKYINTHGTTTTRKVSVESKKVPELFAANVFNDKVMQQTLSEAVYKKVKACIAGKATMDPETADAVANAVKEWAITRGVTHFTHWFQPLTGRPAEKHDGFLNRRSRDEAIMSFSGSSLIAGEPDASSFPNGGLRETSKARGYTLWDPSSPMFIVEAGGTPTLYIPAVFFAWTGESLDYRLPLLRSREAIHKAVIGLLSAAGESGHTSVHVESGMEQEFFLVDAEYYLARPDLVSCGRTLIGRPPSKGQSLDDHYFASITERKLACMREIEYELWKLGIPLYTRHKEVAPNQYEFAPIYEEASIAADHNLVVMEVLQRVAVRHGLVALLHEKPFAGVNGSGKHNNWSFGTDRSGTLLQPGKNPESNTGFLLSLSAIIKAVDEHSDLLRITVVGASNDHRLGANEAPPAIISIYLGDELEALVKKIVTGEVTEPIKREVDLGVVGLPKFNRHATDRNRTSPFAFTGNKFEFRAVGSSHNMQLSCSMLNTIVADAMLKMTADIESRKQQNPSTPIADIVADVIRSTLEKHQRVLFSGNGYSQEWVAEAEKRGLLNLRTTPEALVPFVAEKNLELFERLRVLSRDEVVARQHVEYHKYFKNIIIEAKTLLEMSSASVLPAALKSQTQLAEAITASLTAGLAEAKVSIQRQYLDALAANIQKLIISNDKLKSALSDIENVTDEIQQAFVARDKILPIMQSVREVCDSLELTVDEALWPFPSYHEILHHTWTQASEAL